MPDDNIIKEKYYKSKNIYNFKDYINSEEIKNYKISIIYTYSSTINTFEDFNREMSFNISDIKTEKQLVNLIDEKKNRNENNMLKKDYNIFIHIEQSYSIHIEFLSNLIIENYKNDIYNYIIIIHINRNFDINNNNEKIYSLPDINPDINQIFIDNLNGNNKTNLEDLFSKDMKTLLKEQKDEMDLDDEFDKTLVKFLKTELDKKNLNYNGYIDEVQKYINEEKQINNKIIEITLKIIDNDKDKEKCQDIIDTIYEKELIDNYTLDIASFLVEYIKENIFKKYLTHIFKVLEDNNIFTTLIEIRKNNYKLIKKNIIEEIIKNYLNNINIKENSKFESKFKYNYIIPGFYNFYVNISDFIRKNISQNYLKNEKNLRDLIKEDFKNISC